MITYTPIPPDKWKVHLEGKPIGEIRRSKAGYQYFPKGQKEGGDIFESLHECKRSLESD
jgi:hypothetical protein